MKFYLLICLFFTISTAATPNLFAEESCTLNSFENNLDDFIKVNDYLGLDTGKFKEYKECKEATKLNESCKTKWGTLIDKSCFTQNNKLLSKKEFDDIWTNFEKISDIAIQQSNTCSELIGFKREIHSFLPILRRTKITCFNNSTDRWATAKMSQYRPKISLTNYVNASFDHNFLFELNTTQLNKHSIYDNASLFFHESMHFLSVNNIKNEKHNSPDFKDNSCKSVLSTDFVYRIESACFPKSEHGKQFYENKMYKCQNECIQSLTKNENFDKTQKGNATFFTNQGLIGKTLHLIPYTNEEAKLICKNIHNILPNFEKDKLTLEKLNTKMFKIGTIIGGDAQTKINDIYVAAATYFFHEMKSKTETKKTINNISEKLFNVLKNICSKNDNKNSLICDNNNLAIREYINSIDQFIDNLNYEKFDKLNFLE